MKDVNCPYCDSEQEINHDDGRGYTEGVLEQQECSNCNKVFVYTTSISFYHDAEKADCLNDGKHDYKPTNTYPRQFAKMECSMCGDSRTPTEDERREFNLIAEGKTSGGDF